MTNRNKFIVKIIISLLIMFAPRINGFVTSGNESSFQLSSLHFFMGGSQIALVILYAIIVISFVVGLIFLFKTIDTYNN